MSLKGSVKLTYIIEYNIFLLFVGLFFYFGRFLISQHKDPFYVIFKSIIHFNKNFSFL